MPTNEDINHWIECWNKFLNLRQRVFNLIDIELREDGYCKSYEGATDITISLPNYFAAETDVGRIEFWQIELHCYLLVNGRHITFDGNTFEEALNNFENWVEQKESEELYGTNN